MICMKKKSNFPFFKKKNKSLKCFKSAFAKQTPLNETAQSHRFAPFASLLEKHQKEFSAASLQAPLSEIRGHAYINTPSSVAALEDPEVIRAVLWGGREQGNEMKRDARKHLQEEKKKELQMWSRDYDGHRDNNNTAFSRWCYAVGCNGRWFRTATWL